MIIEKGIKKLVVGTVDPNPRVCGKGIKKCKDAGIEVITGVLENECRKLNEIFFQYQMWQLGQAEKKPFVAIKTATTTDGKIAAKTGSSKWITSEKSRKEVQKLRNKYDAILTGSNTVIIDNPSLTCRMKNGRNPIRIIIDSELKTTPDFNVYKDDGTKVYIAVSENISDKKTALFGENVRFIKCPLKNNKIDLKFLFGKLYEAGLCSILVEAGGGLNGALLKENLIDKVYQFIAPKILADKDGCGWAEGFDIKDINESVQMRIETVKRIGADVFVEYSFIE